MSFQKNPPWQKNVGISNFQQQIGLQQLNQIGFLQNQLGFTNAQLGAQPMMQMNQLVNQVNQVQYSASRVNTMAFQQQPTQQPEQSNQVALVQQPQPQFRRRPQSKYNTTQKLFSGTGVVSKVQNDIGFIDDEVLFHKNVCVKELLPKLGDHVLVEASHNPNMPFKWNATRVQVLSQTNTNSPGSGIQQSNKNYSTVLSPRDGPSLDAYRNRRYSPERRKSPERRPRSRDRREVDVSLEEFFFHIEIYFNIIIHRKKMSASAGVKTVTEIVKDLIDRASPLSTRSEVQ